jgi:hypothetical protein
MAIIHRIGTPENDSEARAIKRFGKDLPEGYFVFHNFEVTTGRGLPYEYDIAVLTPHALYHVEVKGYHGEIRGNPLEWVFENGSVYPSPIPLANKKTKILAGKLRQHSRRLDGVFVETLILLTEDRATLRRCTTWSVMPSSPPARPRRSSGSACTTSCPSWTRTTASPSSWPGTAGSIRSP